MNTAELTGIVERVEFGGPSTSSFKGGADNPLVFHVWASEAKKSFECVSTCGYLPLEKEDRITATVSSLSFDGEHVLYVQDRPLVMIGKTEQAIITRLSNVIKKSSCEKSNDIDGYHKRLSMKEANDSALEFYCWLRAQSETPVEYLSELSNRFSLLSDADMNKDPLAIEMLKVLNDVNQIRSILRNWIKNSDVRSLHLLGLNNTEIKTALCADGTHPNPLQLYKLLSTDPYFIISLSMEKCASIASVIGLEEMSKDELDAALVVRELYEYVTKWSHVGMKNYFFKKNYKDRFDLNVLLPILRDKYGVKSMFDTVYLYHTYLVEETVATSLLGLSKKDLLFSSDSESIEVVFDDESIKLTDEQKNAVVGLLSHNVCLLSAKAGSGKTTLIKQVYNNLIDRDLEVYVLSFTGKAVHRIKTATGIDALTIHRFIALLTSSSSVPTTQLQVEKMEPQVIIIDETSMLSLELFWKLGEATKWDVRFIFVGDVQQLPPIEYGNLFKSLIDSGLFPLYELTVNHRQAAGSVLASFCSDMADYLSGRVSSQLRCSSPTELVEGEDLHIVDGEQSKLECLIKDLFKEKEDVLFDELGRLATLAIITPLSAAAVDINRAVQAIMKERLCNTITTFSSLIDERGRKWNTGDRVLLTANDYLNEVFNGTEGFIVSVKDDVAYNKKKIIVHFSSCDITEVIRVSKEGVPVTRHRRKLLTFTLNKPVYDPTTENGNDSLPKNTGTTDSLLLSYALTVHKAQGSEYSYVIFYCASSASGSFLNRNLAYTALTRAKEEMWVVGRLKEINKVLNTKATEKTDNLVKRFMNVGDE